MLRLLCFLLLASSASAQTWERLDPAAVGLDPASYERGFWEIHNAEGTLIATHNINGVSGPGAPFITMVASTDGGATWAELPATPSTLAPSARLSSSGSRWFVHDDGAAYSDDGGSTWTLATGLNGAVWSIREGTGALYAATQTDAYRSTDDGATWTALGAGNTGRDLVETASGALVYISFLNGIRRSTDGGTTWTTVQPGSGPDALLAAPDGTLYVQGSSLLASSDDGQTWGPAMGISAGGVVTSAAARGNDAAWLTQNTAGVHLARNGGGPDQNITGTFPITVQAGGLVTLPCSRSLAFSGSFLYAAAKCTEVAGNADDPRQGIWRFDLSAIVSSETAPAAPAIAVGPNPASREITVRTEGPVTVGLVDALGRTVRQTDGIGDVGLDVSDLAPGLYLVQVTSGETTTARRITVVR